MHAETLNQLFEGLKTAKNVLDIGTGSGFVSAAMAMLSPPDARVFAVDHIKEINEFAKANIATASPYLMKTGKITFVNQDGREGLAQYKGEKMLYDVIHVGGQLEEVGER